MKAVYKDLRIEKSNTQKTSQGHVSHSFKHRPKLLCRYGLNQEISKGTDFLYSLCSIDFKKDIFMTI